MKKDLGRNVRRQNFTQISNDMLNDPELTLQEKGLLSILLTNSGTFSINMKEIFNRSANGRDAHYKVVNNLIKRGYFARVSIMNEKTNLFEQMIYIFSDSKEDVSLALEEYKKNEFAVINMDMSKKAKEERKANKADNTRLPENQETEENTFESRLPENQETEIQLAENQDINNTNYKNTNYKNTKDINNIYLSKKEEIKKLNVSSGLKKTLENNIDRLITFDINLHEVELHFNANEKLYRFGKYGYVLNKLLEKMTEKPNDYSSVLDNWLKRYSEWFKGSNAAQFTPTRTEIVPEWLKIEQKQEEPKQEEPSPDFLERKAKLEAKLKEKYKKKSVQ